ncbi:Hpt domain-containing protein [Pontiellaceae bacterium B1224]|nr:Hpt domain-containing protein [Pontiellaceae bacterium B1224]
MLNTSQRHPGDADGQQLERLFTEKRDSENKYAADSTDPLMQVEGLDYDAGLYLAANNRELYTVILNAFVTHHCDTVGIIRKALADHDLETARRLVHSLKGTAATIGASSLQKVARAAESAISNEQLDEAFIEIEAIHSLIEPLLRKIALTLKQESKP